MKCTVVQPIDRSGLELLKQAGIEPLVASSTDMGVLKPLLAGADAVITRNWGFPAAAFDAAPKLRVIGVHGTGVDRIDMGCAQRRRIPIVATPGANAVSVAEHALGLMLAVARGIPAADRATRAGDFGFRERFRGIELLGLCLGLWGWGEVARRFAPMAQALGMEVLVLSSHADPDGLTSRGIMAADGIDHILARADVLSLHARPAPLPLLGRSEIAAMKPGAIVLNTGRGALLDEAALADAVRAGHLFGAGIDVYSEEPPAAGHPLLDCPGIVVTPHVGSSTGGARRRMATEVARKVVAVLSEA